MKIEKINNKQVRCILTKQDLSDRQIRVSELAYRTEKAKKLFRDMMQEASNQGFEAEDVPLMIEAIPGACESLELIITKVEDPEELDTRFSRFTPLDGDEDFYEEEIEVEDRWLEEDEDEFSYAGNIRESGIEEILEDALEEAMGIENDNSVEKEVENIEIPSIRRLYMFDNLEDLIRSCERVAGFYNGLSSMYKEESKGNYYLLLENPGNAVRPFNLACNEIAEYGNLQRSGPIRLAHIKEHTRVLIPASAVEKLGNI